jgi:hypothetical protein
MIAGLAVLPATLLAAAAIPADPALALIAVTRAAEIAHGEAIDMYSEAEKADDEDLLAEAEELSAKACWAAHVAAWDLVRTPPTTLAGVAAVLRFANEFEDTGNEWPSTDTIGSEGWHYQLRATTAEAIEALIRQGGAGRPAVSLSGISSGRCR